MRTRTVLAASVVLLVLASCSENPQQPRVSTVLTRVALPLGPVAVGEAFDILVEVENRGKAIEVVTECAEPMGFRVRAEDGRVVAADRLR